ncbi:hypothetical protein [Domibacillus iocasae]|uniref:Uncharacterized protein n=1 Tax=Domibacillus iocasae TaxID=1714016 RepID=A0A1E7DQQ5_9BACI|nr:hypothetical protein [Domibacillus iocasae]OES45335.1 hypothetical protein BA724_04835 [Domibacillus iocasae]
MKTRMRLDQYIPILLEKRRREQRIKDEIYETSDGITSPPGATPTEEIRIFNEYMEQANLLNVTNAAPEKRKPLMLKRFFKMKRNQQVIIYSRSGNEILQTLGKVSAIGRDFVMVTNLRERIWIPYHAIESANIPTGVPTFSNTHQNFIYDNNLKQKLLSNFGETVSKRDVLIQLFYEESLFTNLRSWKAIWMKIQTGQEKLHGKIHDADQEKLHISFFNKKTEMEIKNITSIHSIRFSSLIPILSRSVLQGLFK